jgi:transposase
MSKHFRPWKINQAQLLPPRVQDFVPEDHLSRFIVALVTESLDLSVITASYTSGLGQPPFDPRMMTALLLNGYASGIYSSRRIAKACIERADFMMIVAGDPPDRLKRAGWRSRYRLRKQIVEPVFGQIKQARGFRQFLLRGVEKVRTEWALICTAHNLAKLAKSA